MENADCIRDDPVGDVAGREVKWQPGGKDFIGGHRIDPDVPFGHLVLDGRPIALDISGDIDAPAHDVDSTDVRHNARIEAQRLGEVGVIAADKQLTGR